MTKKMKTENVKLQGMRGTWYVIDSHRTESGTMFYLWENEQCGEDVPAVLTDNNLRVLDTDCYSGIYVALQDNGLFNDWEDETELEDEMGVWELEDADLVNDWDDEI